jgi:ATP phosphoribosyltransferase
VLQIRNFLSRLLDTLGPSPLAVIVDEKTVRELIPVLKKEGASGIVEYPLNKVIP